MVDSRILTEIAGDPWSGGRSGKFVIKAWSMDRYDVAAEMGYNVVYCQGGKRI
ncbi:hypothetical protein RFH42_05580 [Acinetobacter rudis]|uniref:hypothetical protein n=1 Tax=Acinetobacter rudis TaxID=632955 RepID=UPI00281054F0|nr:hypothetical protein [Acinetobacter rudis]MDQ8952433.1 hypothetical protein [Acinetobacter rudis]